MKDPVLFARSGALGDFILTLPVLRALLNTGMQVDVAVPSRFFPLLPEGVRRRMDLVGAELTWLYRGENPHGYQSAVAWSPITVTCLEKAGIRVYSSSPIPVRGPAWAHFATAIPMPVDGPPRLDGEGVRDETVVVAPGSGGKQKRWEVEKWAEVLEGIPAVWLAGPLEAQERWPFPATQLGLSETVALARRCRLWLGPDAGPSHLAAAAGAKVITVFLATDPEIWAPAGATVLVRPSVAEVRAAVLSQLSTPLR